MGSNNTSEKPTVLSTQNIAWICVAYCTSVRCTVKDAPGARGICHLKAFLKNTATIDGSFKTVKPIRQWQHMKFGIGLPGFGIPQYLSLALKTLNSSCSKDFCLFPTRFYKGMLLSAGSLHLLTTTPTTTSASPFIYSKQFWF